MGKTAKIVVCGKKGVGKTSILEQAIYGKLTKDTITSDGNGPLDDRDVLFRALEDPHFNILNFKFLHSTIEDIYVANIETERGVKEHLRFYDTGSDMMRNINFFHADGFILVFDPSKADTLDFIMSIKKEIDRNKERKEVIITVMANHGPQGADPSTFQRAQHWAMREKIKIYEVSAMDRNSLYESFVQLASRLNQQVAKSSFGQLAMRKRD